MKPDILQKGDTISIIAPSSSAMRLGQTMEWAKERLESLDYKIKYQKNIYEQNNFNSSSVASRVEDLHTAFMDNDSKAILTAIGGFNCNELLDYIDFDIIANNPKIFCGYSDITILLNAIYKKTGLITYLGPHFSTFGMKLGLEYTIACFEKIVASDAGLHVFPSKEWSDEAWFLDQENRCFYPNKGWQIFSEGKAEGILIGGNLNTFNLLQGTPYMPDLKGTIIVLEDTSEITKEFSAPEFNRNLQSLIQCTGFVDVRGLIIGRNQRSSNISKEILHEILITKRELINIPIIYDVDFGHTTPMLTLPIGGKVKLSAIKNNIHLHIYNQ